MPSFEEHCEHSAKKYGYRGEEIHRFLDDPSRTYGKYHREFRHDSETVKLVGEKFGKKYGSKTIAENIALDHIMLDHREEIEKRSLKEIEEEEISRKKEVSRRLRLEYNEWQLADLKRLNIRRLFGAVFILPTIFLHAIGKAEGLLGYDKKFSFTQFYYFTMYDFFLIYITVKISLLLGVFLILLSRGLIYLYVLKKQIKYYENLIPRIKEKIKELETEKQGITESTESEEEKEEDSEIEHIQEELEIADLDDIDESGE